MTGFSERVFLLIGIAVVFLSIFAGCGCDDSVRIGFVGTLSGRYSQLGISSRDGFLLAVDEVNASGGIRGCEVEAILANDTGSAEECTRMLYGMFEDDVVAVIGPLTSNMEPAVRSIDVPGVLIVSPTISTDSLTGLDDGFVRVIPNTAEQGRLIAELAIELDLESTAVIFDASNKEYSLEVASAFRDYSLERDRTISGIYGYRRNEGTFPDEPAEEAVTGNPDAVLLVTSGTDAAMIAQALRILGYEGTVIGSQWTRSPDLLAHGGSAIEGMVTVGPRFPKEETGKYADFVSAYTSRFGQRPDFAAMYSYEAASFVLRAAEETGGGPEAVKEALLGRTFDGLTGRISIDYFGDATRDQGYSVVENGEFVDYFNEEP